MVLRALEHRGWKLAVLEVNTNGELTRQLSSAGSQAFSGGKILTALAEDQNLAGLLTAEMKIQAAETAVALLARPQTGRSEIDLIVFTPVIQKVETRGYGGHPQNVPTWGANSALDLLRAALE